jgi:2-polyprenyl-3-methyl-5-hydroxy-6-metoxy-1,4-benzoquinol methylase
MDCILCCGKSEKIDQINSDQLKKNWEDVLDISYLLIEPYYDVFKCSECDLIYFDNRILGDSNFYDKLNKFDWYYDDSYKSEYKIASQFINNKHKVLDVGCGIGIFSKYLDIKKNFTGLELSERAINYGKINDIDIRNELIEDHALKNVEKYDIVTCFQVLEHIENPKKFISSLLKVLKKDGILIIAVPNNDSYLKYIPNNTYNLPPHHNILWRKKQLIKISEIFNLEIKNVFEEKISYMHIPEVRFAFFYYFISLFKKNKIKFVNFSKEHYNAYNLSFKLIKILPKSFVDFFIKISNFRKGHTVTIVYKKK